MNETGLRESAQRVQDALDALGLNCEVVELPGSTRTAVEAAEAWIDGEESLPHGMHARRDIFLGRRWAPEYCASWVRPDARE